MIEQQSEDVRVVSVTHDAKRNEMIIKWEIGPDKGTERLLKDRRFKERVEEFKTRFRAQATKYLAEKLIRQEEARRAATRRDV